jgi:riboflavin synthase
MFTGIIEEIGQVTAIERENSNVHFTLRASMAKNLKIDQSLAHNGCCLTVVEQNDTEYKVTAIQETLDKTNLEDWSLGTRINLERCMKADGRFDGHIVQGHVDCVATCIEVVDLNGSWKYTFRYKADHKTVEKGSITINGTSLTVVDSLDDVFSVCIIPFTYEHTNFNEFLVGTNVNIEFDVFGKYIQKYLNKIG